MNLRESKFLLFAFLFGINLNLFSQTIQYTMPEETEEHEGTWLQWPHQYTYGIVFRNDLDQTWVDMTSALVTSENVHIIAYNQVEQNRIIGLLNNAGVPLSNIDFFIHENDDVWVRDNGPVFVYDNNNELAMLDFGFNGWGNDTPYSKCDVIPTGLSPEIGVPVVDVSALVLEGGAIEHDGNGTMMATRSSVTHSSRNPGLTEAQIENYLTTNMGITHFIWLDGVYGTDITDMHIDGLMKYANDSTILTMNNTDLLYWGLTQPDIDVLYNATDINDAPYNFVTIPLTQNDVTTAYGNNLGYKGSYANYYIANTVVLVPNYGDPNDGIANSIIQSVYPNRMVIGIDVRNLYENGGMVHCVTQQQPVAIEPTMGMETPGNTRVKVGQNYPNPFDNSTVINITLDHDVEILVDVYNSIGQLVLHAVDTRLSTGNHSIQIEAEDLPCGVYNFVVKLDNQISFSQKMTILR